jgi:hypothetical protein
MGEKVDLGIKQIIYVYSYRAGNRAQLDMAEFTRASRNTFINVGKSFAHFLFIIVNYIYV